MIIVSHVTLPYEDSKRIFHVITDASCRFPSWGLCFLVGGAGSGKSTFLAALGGLSRPESGSISSGGHSFGYAPQGGGLVPALSLADNLRLAGRRVRSVKKALLMVGIDAKGRARIDSLSPLDRARLSIGRAMAGGANTLLLDEPTAGLSEADAQKIVNLLRSVATDKLVIVATKNKAMAASNGQMVVALDGERLTVIKKAKEEVANATLSPTAKQNRSIPFLVKCRYAFKKGLRCPGTFIASVLSLFVALSFLFAGVAVDTVDPTSFGRQAVAESDSLFAETSWEGAACSLFPGRGSDYDGHLRPLGITPTYAMYLGLDYANEKAGTKAMLLLPDGLGDLLGGASPKDGEALISDRFAERTGAKAGDDLGDYLPILGKCGITVGDIVNTGHSGPSPLSAEMPASDERTHLFAVVNEDTYLGIAEKIGAMAEGEFDYDSLCRFYLASEAPGSPSLLYGSYPSAADEVMVGEGYTLPSDPGSTVGQMLHVRPRYRDFYRLSEHFSDLRICGVLGGSDEKGIFTSEGFFEAIRGDLKYEADDFLFGKSAELEYLAAGSPSDILVGSSALSEAASFASLTAEYGAPCFFFAALFGVLALVVMAVHLRRLIRKSKTDIATFWSLGKRAPSVASAFLLVNAFPAILAVLFAFGGGFLAVWLIEQAVASEIGLAFLPSIVGFWPYFTVVAVGVFFSLLISVLAGWKPLKKEKYQILMKR